MKPLTKTTAINATGLPKSKVLNYFKQGVCIWFPMKSYRNWMDAFGKDNAHEGRGDSGGVVVRSI